MKQLEWPPSAGRWVILGAGGHARSVVDAIERAGGRILIVAGAAQGSWPRENRLMDDDARALEEASHERCSVALGIGSNPVRARVYERAQFVSVPLPPVLASTATVGRHSWVGSGTVVLEHAHVGPTSRLGVGVIVNTAALVEHDCLVGDFVHLAPRAVVLGGVTIGSGTLVGAGAVVLPGIEVGEECVIGAGAVVTTNIKSGTTVTGVPAKPVAEGVRS